MKKVCTLLTSSILKDFSVIKTIQVLSRYCKVDLFYLRPSDSDKELFNENTRLFALKQRTGKKELFLRHTFFYNEFNYFFFDIIRHEIRYDYVWANDLPALKPALFLKKKFNAKLVYDSHEIYIETLNQFFPEKSHGIKKIVFGALLKLMRFYGSRAERAMVEQTDIFITVSDSVKEYFAALFNRNDIAVVLNCPSLHQETYESVDLKSMLGFDNQVFLLLYQGVMSYGRGLPLMIEAQK
ncbi:MAG TPA: glycosyltransferase, partial [Bacteroidales bacterium]|nr:glycosyltransferase [Bacteroidales bacterium]